MLISFAIIALSIAIGVFFSLDCDPFLYYYPYDNKKERHFENQVVWVTGASSGIGAQLARDFAVSGAHIYISARRTEQLEQIAKECENLGAKSVSVKTHDVLDHNQSMIIAESIIQEHGRIDTLVLNPGRTQRALAMQASVKSTQTIMDLNFMSFVALTKAVVPHMLEKGQGSLIVTSSIAGKMGTPVGSSYSASKWALHGYYDALRAEYAHQGLHVLLVCPGPVVSEITQHSVKGEGMEDKEYRTEDEVKMSTERCSDLTLRAAARKFDEVWVSTQPFLAITYISQYAPSVGRFLFKNLFGPARVNAFLNDGNVFDIKAILAYVFK
eukprot:GSChrysophyteH1.ASY1.ANO1.620.1 assembled CDS